MKFVSILTLLFGYTLVYAGVARGGVIAKNPWLGLYVDVYSTQEEAANPTPPQQSAPSLARTRAQLMRQAIQDNSSLALGTTLMNVEKTVIDKLFGGSRLNPSKFQSKRNTPRHG